MAFQHIRRFNRLHFEKFLPVQSGELTFSGTNTTQTVLSAVDLTKAVLEFSYEIDTTSNDSNDLMVSGVIDNATDLRFNRYDITGTVTIRWYVWEAKPSTNFTVQRGSQDVGSSAGLPLAIAMPDSAVDLDKTFPIISVRSDDGVQLQVDNQIRVEITGTNQITFDKGGQDTYRTIAEYQIIEMTDWDVNKYNIDLSGINSKNQTLSPTVPTTQAYITGTSEAVGATLNGNEIWRMQLSSSSNLDMNRDSTNQGADSTIYVVDTFGDVTTEYLSSTIGSSSDTEAITEVDTARSIIKLGSLQNAQQTYEDGGSDGDGVLVQMQFNSNIEIQATRGANKTPPTTYRCAVHQFN
jgi:hypothetical protein